MHDFNEKHGKWSNEETMILDYNDEADERMEGLEENLTNLEKRN